MVGWLAVGYSPAVVLLLAGWLLVVFLCCQLVGWLLGFLRHEEAVTGCWLSSGTGAGGYRDRIKGGLLFAFFTVWSDYYYFLLFFTDWSESPRQGKARGTDKMYLNA